MLKLYGLDPDEIKHEMETVAARRKQITENFDQTLSEGKAAWSKWIVQYKTLLATKSFSDESRVETQNKANPAFVLRNYLLEEAISKAESGDFSQVNILLESSKKPFEV